MSYRETPEQRQIREMKERLRRVEAENGASSRRAKELQQQLQRAQAQMQNAQRRADAIIAEQRRRNDQLSANLQALDRQVQQQEQLHLQRIQQIQQQHRQDMVQQQRQLQQTAAALQQGITQTRREVEALGRHVEEEVSDIRATRDRDIAWARGELDSVNQRIDTMQQAIAQNAELAEYWIQQAQRITAEIREGRPEKFLRPDWEALQQAVADAVSDLSQGREQVAVSGGRTAFREALELRTRLAEEEARWQQTLGAVRTLEQSLLSGLQTAESTVYEMELDGETVSDDSGLDYWSYGHYAIVRQRIDDALARLNANTDDLSTEQLAELEQELTSLLAELALVQNAGADNFTMAQARFGLAQRIGALLGDDYQMVEQDGDFFRREPNDEYHAVFRNPETGMTAVVVITPEVDGNGRVTNHAELLVDTVSNDPALNASVNQAVVEGLQESHEDFALPCSGQYGDKTGAEAQRMGDISAVSAGSSAARSAHAAVDEKGRPVPQHRCAPADASASAAKPDSAAQPGSASAR